MEHSVEQVASAMIAYDAGDPRRIHHFLKVHAFARLIGLSEGLDGHTQSILRPPPWSTTSASTRRRLSTAAAKANTRRSWDPLRRKRCWWA